jgi:hypothetical protein
MTETSGSGDDVKTHLERASGVVDSFMEEGRAFIEKITRGVEKLIEQARQPKAAPPNAGEGVRAALAEFDGVMDRLGEVKTALATAASKVETGATDPSTSGSTGGSSTEAGGSSLPGEPASTGDPGDTEGIPVGGGGRSDPSGGEGEPIDAEEADEDIVRHDGEV